LTRTHPADARPLSPVFAVDHILTLSLPGSDHRALLADIANR
jgi:hypothetical protein